METTTVETFCAKPFRDIILNSCGDVSMCCDQYWQLGSLNEQTNVLDIWNGPVAQELREKHLTGELHPICTSGRSCIFMTHERRAGKCEVYQDYFPMNLEISLPDTHCNIGGPNPGPENPACIMCRRNFNKPSQANLTDLLCEKAKPLVPYLRSITVLGIAEPFWQGAIFDVLEKIEFKKYSFQLEVRANTNGICLHRKMTDRFLKEVRWSHLSWSLDAARPKTYWKIRRKNIFPQVLENLKYYNQKRKQVKDGGHKCSIYNNINLLNVDEMAEMVALAKECGADNIVFVPTMNYLPNVQLQEITMNEKNFPIFRENTLEAVKEGKKLGFPVVVVHKIDQPEKPKEGERKSPTIKI